MPRPSTAKQVASPGKVVRWQSNPGPQSAAFNCTAEILLYGGAAGGGKTDFELVAAAENTHYDGYQGIIFRRTYKELEKHIIDRSRQLYEGIGRYNEKEYKWTFPTRSPYTGKLDGGRSHIYLAYLERDKDVFNYHGGAFQFVGFDESTMFSAFQVRYMLTRLRTTNPSIRKRMVLTSNPIGPGLGWHKLMFIEDADGLREPYKIYRNAYWPDLEPPDNLVHKTTCYIPAKIYDNPVQMAADPGYIDNIRSQGGAIARALLDGSWNEKISMAVSFDKKIHVIDPIEIPPEAPRWLGIDWGKSDRAACVWQTSFGGRVYWYRDLSRPGEIIIPFAQEIVAASVGEKIDFAVLSHETFADRGQGQGHTQADQFVEVFSKAGIPVVKSDKDPEGRLMLLREMLRTTRATISQETKGLDDYEYWQQRVLKEGDKAWKEYARLKLLSSDGELPRLQVFRRLPNNLGMGCPYIIQSLPLLTVDLEKPKKIADGQDDHGFDAGTYGLKGYIFNDETKLLDAYMEQIGKGNVPDSGFAAELAMKAAQEKLEEGEEGGDEPFTMKPEPYDDEDGGFYPGI